jgi:hypothetical protein
MESALQGLKSGSLLRRKSEREKQIATAPGSGATELRSDAIFRLQQQQKAAAAL